MAARSQYRGTVEGSLENHVSREVDLWLAWLLRWRPKTHRGRPRVCRRCVGSPLLAAAGLDQDAPHDVQHSLTMRLKAIVDTAVDDYTARNLPNLDREIRLAEERKARRAYRADEGLDPEFRGMELDPEPVADHPFLFTLAGFDEATASAEPQPEVRPFTPLEKEALRDEIRLADEFAKQVGRRACVELTRHRSRIRTAVDTLVEPHIADMLAELERELSTPGWFDV